MILYYCYYYYYCSKAVGMYVGMHAMGYVWRSKTNLLASVLSPYMGPGDQTLAMGQGQRKLLYMTYFF